MTVRSIPFFCDVRHPPISGPCKTQRHALSYSPQVDIVSIWPRLLHQLQTRSRDQPLSHQALVQQRKRFVPKMNLDPEKQAHDQRYHHHKEKVPHWRLVASQSLITDAVANYPYNGSGTEDDPYVVEFIPNDPRNPMEFSQVKKWFITLTVAIATLAVAFVSSAYSGGANEVIATFGVSQEVYTLGISLFVLGFAIGPLLW